MGIALHGADLRPGVALGAYPEREPEDAGFFERLLARAARRFWPGRKGLSRAALERFAQQVDTVHRDLPATDTASRQMLNELRRALAREGLTDALVARCFAFARRAAQQQIGLQPYPRQIIAGRVMLAGGLAEMQTGEGKTLAATLPASCAALAGIPVHVVTANDYLVTRDAAAMGPVYRALGLSVGAITEASSPQMRREAYARDITYITSKQLAFDYLRDRLARGERRGAVHTRVTGLAGRNAGTQPLLMRGLCFAIIDEADSVLIDEARTPFVIAAERDDATLGARCATALTLARTLQAGGDYVLDAQRRQAQLTDAACARITGSVLDLPVNRRTRIAIVEQALTALHLYVHDRDYIVRDDQVQIVDPLSGRVMADRSWNQGLQQMIECKEGCTVTAPRDTLARMTYQRFFRRYLRLGGMTGTAREVASEIWSTYALPVIAIDTHRPCVRTRLPARVCASAEARWAAIVERVQEVSAQGRPVLIGTRSVADSECLSERLAAAGLEHEVLNARQDAREARIIAGAGNPGRITVATNMAGRGTDIALAEGVAARGGLHVIAAELNDAARLDRQLAGRCARQGEPGSTEVFVSPDDEIIVRAGFVRVRACLKVLCGTYIGSVMSKIIVRMAQRQCERGHRTERRDLAIIQDRIDKLLSFAGQPE